MCTYLNTTHFNTTYLHITHHLRNNKDPGTFIAQFTPHFQPYSAYFPHLAFCKNSKTYFPPRAPHILSHNHHQPYPKRVCTTTYTIRNHLEPTLHYDLYTSCFHFHPYSAYFHHLAFCKSSKAYFPRRAPTI